MSNQGITDTPVPPWQLPGAVRRDCEPHRVELFQRLSLITSLLAAAGVLLVVPGLLALALAVAVWLMARHDLALMRLGRVDPAGEADTRQARGEAVFAALLAPLAWAVIALIVWACSRRGGW
jgi:hypothetical protein